MQKVPPETTGQPRTTSNTTLGSKLVLRALISASLLLILIASADLQTIGALLASVSLLHFGVAVFLLVLNRFLLAYKWNLLTNVKGLTLSVWQSVRIYWISSFFGILLPTGVGGDIYRIYHTSRRVGQTANVAASVVLERFIGLLAKGLFAVLGLILMTQLTSHVLLGYMLYVAVFGFLVVSLIIFWISVHDVTVSSVRFIRDRWGGRWLFDKWAKFQDAYVGYKLSKKTLGIFFILSLLEGALFIVVNYYGAEALNLEIGLVYFIGIIPICRVINSIPISIGGIGVQEASYVFFFSSVGASVSQAFALALLVRIALWLSYLPGAILYLTESHAEKEMPEFGTNRVVGKGETDV